MRLWLTMLRDRCLSAAGHQSAGTGAMAAAGAAGTAAEPRLDPTSGPSRLTGPVLARCSQGRDNNLNLIRFIAAAAVLVTHSFALVTGSGDAEPLRQQLGMTLGSIAVDVFFSASGFLVTASLLSRRSAVDFIWARVLRIFPALLVMLGLTVFGLGLAFTTLPAATYLSSRGTYVYLAKCASLMAGVTYELPGVFGSNPYPRAVNGSLWTMPYELRVYAVWAVGWIVLGLWPARRERLFRAAVLICTPLAAAYVLAEQFGWIATSDSARLFYMFLVGASLQILKQRIVMSGALAAGLALALLLASVEPRAFAVLYLFSLSYLLLWLAYVPAGVVRRYNQLGDYSYGIYIYAFPVQQAVAALWPGVGVPSMVLLSGAATLALAILSWHLIEQRALALKPGITARSLAWLGRA